MTSFSSFALLPAEIQDLIWVFALPGPRVVAYDARSDLLVPFSPATASTNSSSRYRTLKTYTPIESPKTPGKCIGYLNYSLDCVLFSSLPSEQQDYQLNNGLQEIGDDVDGEEKLKTSIAKEIDSCTAASLSNAQGTWSRLRFMAISVPIFLGTIASGGGGFVRAKPSPTLNAICALPALEAIAIVSTGKDEMQHEVVGQAEATWDERNIFRKLTANEAGAGWAILMRESLMENWAMEEGKDANEEGSLGWGDWKRKLWRGFGPEVVHLGLETEGTRREMRESQHALSRDKTRKRAAVTYLTCTKCQKRKFGWGQPLKRPCKA